MVAAELRLTDDAGAVLESASASVPFVYLHGHGAIPKAIEAAFEGREVGERFEKAIAPEELVGPKRTDADRALPIDAFPPGALPDVGTELELEEGTSNVSAWVVAIHAEHVRVSLDHPWAGRSVTLIAEVLKVRAATDGELARGEADGIEPLDASPTTAAPRRREAERGEEE